MKKISMIVPNSTVKGGIASVVNGYRNSKLEADYNLIYIESYQNGSKVSKLIKGIKGYFRFAKVLLIDKPDLVHIHSSFGPSFYRKLPFIYMASCTHTPIINHIHGADFDEFFVQARDKKKKLIKKAYEKCSLLIALSDEWKECLSRIVPIEKIKVIENYSVLHKDAYEQRSARNSNYSVLFLGELGKRKGCFDIPKIADRVIDAVPQARFVLAGAGSEHDEQKLKAMFTEAGIGDRVIFPGWIRENKKDEMLRSSDIFFLPSYNEGMPMSVLDAMGYGLPVVSTNVGGIPKIVHNGENGYCCEAGNVEELSTALIELLQSDGKQLEMGAKSLEIVDKGYSLDYHIKLLEDVYEFGMI